MPRDKLAALVARTVGGGGAEKVERLAAYVELLREFGWRAGAVGYRDEEALLVEGVADACLAFAAAFRVVPAKGSLVDVGSGGGLPGVVWAILAEDLRLTFLEAERRKVAFLEWVVRRLGLGAEVVWGRAEVVGRGARREAFSLALTRAAAKPEVALELVAPLVAVGGFAFLLVGAAASREAVSGVAGALGLAPAGAEGYELPGGRRREVWRFTKERPTPDLYPRGTKAIRRGASRGRGTPAWTA